MIQLLYQLSYTGIKNYRGLSETRTHTIFLSSVSKTDMSTIPSQGHTGTSGFEPKQVDLETTMLPLHHVPISNTTYVIVYSNQSINLLLHSLELYSGFEPEIKLWRSFVLPLH